jgi:hypothetical protein
MRPQRPQVLQGSAMGRGNEGSPSRWVALARCLHVEDQPINDIGVENRIRLITIGGGTGSSQ